MRRLLAASMRKLRGLFPGRQRVRVIALGDGGFYIYTGKPPTLLDVLRDGTCTFQGLSACEEAIFDGPADLSPAPETGEATPEPEPWCYCI